MGHIPELGLLALACASGCAARQATHQFAGQWSVVELRIDGDRIPFPATMEDDDCTHGYAILVDSDGTRGEVRYEYSYDCGGELVYYSLPVPVTITGAAGLVSLTGFDLEWTCSSTGSSSWECSRRDGAVLVLEPR